MRGKLLVILALLVAVPSCGRIADSPVNPLNWFGRSVAVDSDTSNPAADPRPLVTQVTALRLERVPGGAIIHATGLAARQGYYGGALVPLNRGMPVDGLLAYQFRVKPPIEATRSGPARSREIIVGLFVSDQTLAGVRQIQVSGETNALATGR